MEPSNAMLILASELNESPGLLSIDAKRLLQILEIYRGVIPDQSVIDRFTEGWMVWDEELGKWTFDEWYWSSSSRTWRPVRIQVVKVIDDQYNAWLTSVSDADAIDYLGSITLDVIALQGLAQMALKKNKHVMAVQQGFRLFTHFEAFELMFLEAVGST